jgi:hypothetical protein
VSYFLLIYDREIQRIIELREFSEDNREEADATRLAAQRLALANNLDQDIVLFQAASEEALRRSHGSYFFSERELLERTRDAAEAI